MKTLFWFSLLCLLTNVLLLAAYERWVARPARVIGVVDVAAVYREKEGQFTRLIATSRADGREDQALALAREFSLRLPAAMAQLPAECRCVVLDRSVLIGLPPGARDLTDTLREKVK